jgi:hypothetical protein
MQHSRSLPHSSSSLRNCTLACRLVFLQEARTPTGSLNLFAKDIPSGSPLSKDESPRSSSSFLPHLLQQAKVHFTSQTEHRNH